MIAPTLVALIGGLVNSGARPGGRLGGARHARRARCGGRPVLVGVVLRLAVAAVGWFGLLLLAAAVVGVLAAMPARSGVSPYGGSPCVTYSGKPASVGYEGLPTMQALALVFADGHGTSSGGGEGLALLLVLLVLWLLFR